MAGGGYGLNRGREIGDVETAFKVLRQGGVGHVDHDALAFDIAALTKTLKQSVFQCRVGDESENADPRNSRGPLREC